LRKFSFELKIDVLVFGFEIYQKRVEIKRKLKQVRKNVAVDVVFVDFDKNSTTFFQDVFVEFIILMAE
jgi:hypothetical protein